MESSVHRAWWSVIGCTIALTVVIGTGRSIPDVLAQDSCPAGQVPLPAVTLADLPLPADLPPGATIALTHITLGPGESVEPAPSGYSAYYVESGVMKYQFQPWLTIVRAPKCVNEDGRFSGGGAITIDADDMVEVNPGEALIAEDVQTGPIINGGTTPLVLLQMSLVFAEIDPVTGLPITDPGTAGRAVAKAFEQQKEACKAAARAAATSEAMGTPVAELRTEERPAEAIATPEMSTAGWEVRSESNAPKIPRACKQ